MNFICRAFILACFLALGSCGSFFAPNYNETIYKKIEGVNASLAKIETVTETKAPAKATYSDVEPYYIEALAGVKEAKEIADSKPAYLKGRPAADAAQALAGNIGKCQDAIESSRSRFKSVGQASNEADNLAIVRNVCGIPNTMQSALR